MINSSFTIIMFSHVINFFMRTILFLEQKSIDQIIRMLHVLENQVLAYL